LQNRDKRAGFFAPKIQIILHLKTIDPISILKEAPKGPLFTKSGITLLKCAVKEMYSPSHLEAWAETRYINLSMKAILNPHPLLYLLVVANADLSRRPESAVKVPVWLAAGCVL